MKEKHHTTYTFRLPNALKDAIIADAKRHSRSVNKHFVDVMTAYLAGELIPAEKLLSEPSVRKLLQAAVQLPKKKPGNKQ